MVTALGMWLPRPVVVAFIDSVKEEFGVEPVCTVLSRFVCKIAPSTYYAAKARPKSQRAQREELIEEVILELWHDPAGGREVYGARKMWKLLAKKGITVAGKPVARCTIERVMHRLGLFGVGRGKAFYATTCQADPGDPEHVRAPDRVNRRFLASAPNQLWVVDFTYLDTQAGKVYAAFVMDVFSRRIVGWAVSDHHATELPLAALEMALFTKVIGGENVAGMVHHSDAGSEYTAIRYRRVLADFHALASIGTVGDSYDNAMCESLIGVFKAEVYHRRESWTDVDEVEAAVAAWVGWYNHDRLHSSLNDMTPIEWESAYHTGELTEVVAQAEAILSEPPPPRENDPRNLAALG